MLWVVGQILTSPSVRALAFGKKTLREIRDAKVEECSASL